MSSTHSSPGAPLLTSVPSRITSAFVNGHSFNRSADHSSDHWCTDRRPLSLEVQRSAAALTFRARSRAQTRMLGREVESLRARLQEERTAHVIQRAGAEHARRAVQCMRECIENLLALTLQPCLTLNRSGKIMRWNPALTQALGASADQAIGKPVEALLSPDLCLPIRSLLTHFLEQERAVSPCYAQTVSGPFTLSGDKNATSATLIPLYHVPGCPEAVIVLIDEGIIPSVQTDRSHLLFPHQFQNGLSHSDPDPSEV